VVFELIEEVLKFQISIYESKILLLFERVGEVLVACLLLIFNDFNIQGISAWLITAFVLMIMYELYWIWYFKSEKTMKDFYSSLMGIPVAGAILPVVACGLIAIYERNPILFVAAIILCVGHIGIHLNHKKEL
jgi:hypothetical protein